MPERVACMLSVLAVACSLAALGCQPVGEVYQPELCHNPFELRARAYYSGGFDPIELEPQGDGSFVGGWDQVAGSIDRYVWVEYYRRYEPDALIEIGFTQEQVEAMSEKKVTVEQGTTPTTMYLFDHCWDLNNDREFDPEEEDSNQNGVADAGDCNGDGPSYWFDLVVMQAMNVQNLSEVYSDAVELEIELGRDMMNDDPAEPDGNYSCQLLDSHANALQDDNGLPVAFDPFDPRGRLCNVDGDSRNNRDELCAVDASNPFVYDPE